VRRVAVAAAALLLLLLLLFALRAPILAAVARFLTIDDARAPADAIVLLNGGLDTRPAAAAALYGQGLAPIVVIGREEDSRAVQLDLLPNRTDVVLGLLRHDGVPDAAIRQLRTPGGTASTEDEAELFAAYARLHDFERVIVVTSDYHTRRARRAFRHALDPLGIEVRMAAVPSADFRPADWWRTESGLLAISQEYVKLFRDVLLD
jgi:uncharacterized SAM-binding protein YcdF (DUF218 family)